MIYPALCHHGSSGSPRRADAENLGDLTMSDHDVDAQLSVDQSGPTGNRLRGRRKQIAAGAAGLAVLLGGGAYLITTRAGETTPPSPTGALAPVGAPDATAEGIAVPAATPSSSRGAAMSPPRSLAMSPSRSLAIDQRAKAAREYGAKHSRPVQRALTPAPNVKAAVDVQERSEPVENGSLRIITARSDLTGQRALLWAADKGKPHGDVTCTQNFHFSDKQEASVRPNLLLCWRTSDDKSVATILVDQGGEPSRDRSAEIIDREWAKLG
jgi:hypothetical protein